MRFKKRYLLPLLLVAIYFLGPRVSYEKVDGQLSNSSLRIDQLEDHVIQQNQRVTNLKPDNHSRLIWADSVRKTEYSIVYLHGFSASPMEGNPIHREFAERYGANLYIPRLAGHGIQDPQAFAALSPDDLIQSAKEAIQIGKIIGEKVILMSCSTGSTLALYLGAKNPDWIAGQFLFSPNIDLHDQSSELLTMPWGEQLAYALLGETRSIEKFKDTEMANYWTTTYSTKGILALKSLIESTMTEEVLQDFKQPYLLAYYYQDEDNFDDVVSIEAMHWFHKLNATPAPQKSIVALSEVGDHVMVSSLLSHNLDQVRKVTYDFAEQVLQLQPQ